MGRSELIFLRALEILCLNEKERAGPEKPLSKLQPARGKGHHACLSSWQQMAPMDSQRKGELVKKLREGNVFKVYCSVCSIFFSALHD